MPLWLIKSFLERFQAAPQGSNLTYAIVHPVFRKEPWVLDLQCEQPYLLLGHERHFRRYGGILRRVLASPYCRSIICAVEAGRRAFLSIMGCEELEPKVSVVHAAVPKRNFGKSFDEGKIKLLFVNSGNINTAWHFEVKGAKEVVESFLRLRKRYDNLELVLRSGMSPEMKKRCQGMGIRVIDSPIPWQQLEQEWMSADIFVLPTRVTPFGVFLDAMSYELPIVTTAVWANSEMVDDGRTGFLVPKTDADQYIVDSVVHLHSPRFERAVKVTDLHLVDALTEKLRLLIENRDLRTAMGRAGRWEVEQGKFSIERRNEKLREIFDEATR